MQDDLSLPAQPVPPTDTVAALVRASFDSAPDGLVVFERVGDQMAFNPAFVRLWQLPPDMAQRQDLAEVRAHMAAQLVDPEGFVESLRAISEGRLNHATQEIDRLDGRVYERRIAPLRRQGLSDAVVVRWRDVTDRRRTEVALQQAQVRLAAVFEHALDAILLADDQGRYLDANPAACQLLGHPRESLLQMTVADVYDAPSAGFEQAWAAFLQQGSASGQVTLRCRDGRRVLARFSAVARIQPGVHLSILSDITEQERDQRLRAETAAQMELAAASADIVFWSVDLRAGRIDNSNADRLTQTLGYASTDIGPGLQAWDALVHPEDFERREASWQAHVEGRSPLYEAEFRMRHKSGHWVWMLARGRALERDARGLALRVAGMRIDITRRKQAEAVLERQAFTDGLTGTLNRRRFVELASVEVTRAQRHGLAASLLMIDLDHFKAVNDRHGHAAGDAVLQSFAGTVSSILRASDLFGRVGGEEFAVLLPQTDRAGAAALAQRLLALVREQPAPVNGNTVPYTVSIGVSTLSDLRHNPDIEGLMLLADRALYGAKAGGRNRAASADPADTAPGLI